MTIGAPRGKKRVKTLSISMTEEEIEAIHAAAAFEGLAAATWARDVLISRALKLYRDRMTGVRS